MERQRRVRRVDDILVCDEPLRELLRGLRGFAADPCGVAEMLELGGAPPAADASSILRAVMRIEADLLRQDADDLADAAQEQRSQGARRGDALVVLIERITAAAPFVRCTR